MRLLATLIFTAIFAASAGAEVGIKRTLMTKLYCRDSAAVDTIFRLGSNNPNAAQAQFYVLVNAGRCVSRSRMTEVQPVDWIKHVWLGLTPVIVYKAMIDGEDDLVWSWTFIGAMTMKTNSPKVRERGI